VGRFTPLWFEWGVMFQAEKDDRRPTILKTGLMMTENSKEPEVVPELPIQSGAKRRTPKVIEMDFIPTSLPRPLYGDRRRDL
jgi:hypothetical protein